MHGLEAGLVTMLLLGQEKGVEGGGREGRLTGAGRVACRAKEVIDCLCSAPVEPGLHGPNLLRVGHHPSFLPALKALLQWRVFAPSL